MAKQYIVLEVGPLTAGVHPLLRYVRVPKDFTFTIEHIDVSTPAPNSDSDAVFNVRKGATLASLSTIFAMPADRPKIVAGATSGEVSGLSVAVAAGSYIVFDADAVPVGGLTGPIFLTMRVEDGTAVVGPTGATGATGATGPTGQGFTWRGVWDVATAYAAYDVVKWFDGETYQTTSFVALASSTGVTPGSDPTKWETIVDSESPKLLVDDVINTFYSGALARVPTSGELSAAQTTLNGARISNAIDFIAAMKSVPSAIFGGAEYIARARTDTQYVYDLYAALLDRLPENAGVVATYVALVASVGRTAVLNNFLASTEFYEHRIVRAFWYSLTGYDAASILGKKFSALPANGQTFAYNSTTQAFDPASISGGSSVETFAQMMARLAPEFWFRLGEASGTFADSSTHATSATLNGSGFTRAVTGLVSGDSDNALQVAGAADISIPHATRLQPATITLFAIFKPTSSATAGPLVTSNHTDYWSQGRGFHLTIDSAGKAHAIFARGGAAPFAHAVGSTVTQAGSTYVIAATFDGETVNLYVNGALEASADFPYNISWSSATDWRIASNQQAGGGTPIYASGVIDEAALFSTALSFSDVEALTVKARALTDPPTDADIEYIYGFEMSRIDGTNIKIGRGACWIPSERGIRRINDSVSMGIGTVSNSTWYYVYAYWSSGHLNFEISSTAPVLYGKNAATKSGDMSRRFTGCVFKTTSGGAVSDFDSYIDAMHEARYDWKELTNTGIWRIVNAGNPGNGSTSSAQDISAVVPDVVFKKFKFQATLNVGNGDVVNFGIEGTRSTIPFSAWYCAEWGQRIDCRSGTSSATGQMPSPGEIHLAQRSFIYIISYVSSGTVTIDAKGFTVRR